ncbi:MAG: MFS transporter [Burkholderiales bacterium RIFCSPLOWO2_12_67_14]|nr:MAG: MFS transporter [Burkholderiales bacterium RIFCSPLOWO2_02_FULL_67_64]OGB35827.1 MAG: MFS transporter [Burkholderiales bacterium RIFCSPHIGHO2_12_FULL_67_38]OGB43382.1 MAG: MFS transporter [Burkholderiales bacterium RIFCSPLOWO2_12_67_14]OGC02304.1 MAG: MFS transporter [Burkholderiales bacterium RIFCSPLOWO2_12_FULL_67_210]
MALFSSESLNPGVRKREVFGWAMYDFANSGYTTVVLTAVFAAYFVGSVAGGADWATFAWTLALSASHAVVMFTIPALGAWADRRAAKKRLLLLTTVGCVLATAALALVGPGAVVLGMLLVMVSNVFFAWGESLIAAFLPELARPAAMGRVSGWGWSFGYLGGMLALGLSLAYVIWAQAHGQPASQFVPVTMLITAGIFAVASVFTLGLLRERAQATGGEGGVSGVKASLRQLGDTLRRARNYRDFMWLLGCAVAYQGGVAVAITLAAIYAEQVIGFVQQETMVLIFVLNIAAALGAFAFGYWQDRLGHKLALGITLVGWMATCIIAALTTTKGGFWYAAAIAGLCMGSSQSSGRAMAGMLAPPRQLAEFYGLWTFATRLASIIGPLSYGAITWATGGNQRLAIGFTALLFLLGLVLLLPVNMERGRRAVLSGPGLANA